MNVNPYLVEEMPFGKYKGQQLIMVLNDSSYVLWVLMQPSLWKNYPETLRPLYYAFGADDLEQAIESVRWEAQR